jgi:UDP-glucose 4-epimerase
MKCLVTGGAGFIGSNLVDRLLKNGHEVTVYDNFTTGMLYFLKSEKNRDGLTIIKNDLLKQDALRMAMRDQSIVFHLAANADVRYGFEHPAKDLNQNTLATFNVLEAMRVNGVKRIAFASTSAVYGEPNQIPTPESVAFPQQTSLYGASKLACEGLIEAYCEGFGMHSWIFRFVSILGERYTHGHVFDFYKQLKTHPDYLDVLGDGTQRKSYLYVQDCIEGILHAVMNTHEHTNIFNLGTDEYCQVKDSIKWITETLSLNPEIRYKGGKKGWIGDNPFTYLDTTKIRNLGWKPKHTIQESIIKTVEYLDKHPKVLVRDK